MLENQQKYIAYTQAIENVLAPFNYAFIESKRKAVKDFQQKLKEIDLIVPIIGGFSAGKSTLINSFLGNDMLPVNIAPETALPAELRYNTENYMEAVMENGKKDRFSLTHKDFERVKAGVKTKNYRYLRIYVNNPNLKAIAPLVLVDMPGFSSPVAEHDQVILDYRNKGHHFIFLHSVEDGTIQNNILQELEKLNGVSKGFSFCLSKSNLRPPSAISDIEAQIREQLEEHFEQDFDGEITRFSNASGENLKKLILSINPEGLIDKIFKEDLTDNSIYIQSEIKKFIESLDEDAGILQRKIDKIEEGFKKIKEQGEKEQKEINNTDTTEIKAQIITEVEHAVMRASSELANTALDSQYKCQEQLILIVKNSLESKLEEEINKKAEKILSNFQYKMDELDISNRIDMNFINEITASIKKEIKKTDASIDLAAFGSALSSLEGLLTGSLGKILLTVGKILAQIPIVGMLSNFFGGSNDDGYWERRAAKESAKMDIQKHIETTVLNQVKKVLDKIVSDALRKALSQMAEEILNACKKRLEAEKERNKEALKEQEDNLESTKNNKKDLENALTLLADLQQQYL